MVWNKSKYNEIYMMSLFAKYEGTEIKLTTYVFNFVIRKTKKANLYYKALYTNLKSDQLLIFYYI